MTTEQHQITAVRSDQQSLPDLRDYILPVFHDTQSLSPEIEKFILRCEKDYGLPLEVWTNYLITWVSALNAFSTPTSFLDALTVSPVYDHDKPCVTVTSFEGKFALQQALLAEHQFVPTDKQLKEHGLTKTEFDGCGGCQSVIAVEARMTKSLISSGLISPHDQFLHMANAYPFEPGGSMIFVNRHDDLTNRNIGKGVFIFEQGKTFDAILSLDFVLAAFTCADAHNLACIRNHTVTGKSVGEHDHFQFFPSDLRKAGLLRHVNECPEYTHDFSGKVLYRPSNFSIFDTMVVSSTDVFKLAKAVTELGEKLERAGIPFTLAYYNGHCLVGPCRKLPEYKKSSLGARAVLHYFFQSSQKNSEDKTMVIGELDKIEDMFEQLPRPGQFNWQGFLPEI